VDAKPTPPVQSIPREKRNWSDWRKKRVKKLFKNLPKMAPKFQRRFEVAVSRSKKFTDRVNRKAEGIQKTIKTAREARRIKDRRGFIKATKHLKGQVLTFRRMVGNFRKGQNRVRVMGRLSHRLEKFVTKKSERFTAQELSVIKQSFTVISEKRKQLRNIFRRTVKNIKLTFREIRKFRQEIKTMVNAKKGYGKKTKTRRW